MKYTKEQYLAMEYFDGDEEVSNQKMQLVTTRKEHQCVGLEKPAHTIPARSKAILETAILADIGRASCYLCLNCADVWLNEIHGV